MAGSQAEHPRDPLVSELCVDPMVAARFDAVKLLAEQVPNPVMVIDRDHTIQYANAAVWEQVSRRDSQDSERSSVKCYEAINECGDPCGQCAAMELFEANDSGTVSSSLTGGEGVGCTIMQAHSLTGTDGEIAAVLLLLKNQLEPSSLRSTPVELASFVDGSNTDVGLGELIGQSPRMRQLFDLIRRVSESQATVLIQGESGTGKELVARMIHRLSDRRECPFVVVDCGSLPETLLESELFGHVKGAFTGAVASKRGLFEEADGGTIFLDEIADTTPQFQAKLLRVLQEGDIKPVGSSRGIQVNVRVLSASNKELLPLVQERRFRQDLYYRLAVLPLHLPSLRERREDIPLLVRHFVSASCIRHRRPIRPVTPAAMQMLVQAAWPGNVRELQHAIERVIVTTTGSVLCETDLHGLAGPAATTGLRSAGRHAAEQAERTKILAALEETGGNRVKAARLLKISRAGLYNKLKAYRLA